jgi:hypothetical protein
MSSLPFDPNDEAGVFIGIAAQAVAEAESQIGLLVWTAGQALEKAFEKVPHGQWADACVAIGITERRALQYRQVFQRFKAPAELPNVGRELLITLASPSTPETVIESVVERVDAGITPSIRAVQAEIKEAKAQAPTEFDHDKDRTRMAPEPPEETASDRVQKAIKAVEKAVVKAKAACVESKSKRDWQLLEDTLANLTEDVRYS